MSFSLVVEEVTTMSLPQDAPDPDSNSRHGPAPDLKRLRMLPKAPAGISYMADASHAAGDRARDEEFVDEYPARWWGAFGS